MAENGSLTDRQQNFIDKLIELDYNQTAAYKASYSGVKSDAVAAVNASRMLRNAKVRSYLKARQAEIRMQANISKADIVRELAKIGFANIGDYLEYKTVLTHVGINGDGSPVIGYAPVIRLRNSEDVDTSAVAEVSLSDNGTLKFKLYDKRSALMDIAKILGFDKENEASGDDNDTPGGVVVLPEMAPEPEPPDIKEFETGNMDSGIAGQL